MTPRRELPPDLIRALRRARQAEDEALRLEDRTQARRTTGWIMLRAVEDGWPIVEIARALGMNPHLAGRRVTRARQLRDTHREAERRARDRHPSNDFRSD